MKGGREGGKRERGERERERERERETKKDISTTTEMERGEVGGETGSECVAKLDINSLQLSSSLPSSQFTTPSHSSDKDEVQSPLSHKYP